MSPGCLRGNEKVRAGERTEKLKARREKVDVMNEQSERERTRGVGVQGAGRTV